MKFLNIVKEQGTHKKKHSYTLFKRYEKIIYLKIPYFHELRLINFVEYLQNIQR